MDIELFSSTKEPEGTSTSSNRRSFLTLAAMAGAAAAAVPSVTFAREDHKEDDDDDDDHRGLTRGDRDILIAAEIAEALAVTTYSNIIDKTPFFPTLESDDQGYLITARQEEMSHYLLEESLTSCGPSLAPGHGVTSVHTPPQRTRLAFPE